MKTIKWFNILSTAALLFAATSCKKEGSLTSEETDVQSAIATSEAIALAPDPTSPGDSIYAVNACSRGSRKDSIAFGSLPASVTGYLTANYAGYTASRAYSIKDAAGTQQGYVAVIQFNGSPVGLRFDASGNFLRVLEQREGSDVRGGRGHHGGGRFENRDGRQRDTIALSSLSSTIKSYYAANYATDTLQIAFTSRDGNTVVVSKNGGVFATVFSSAGAFVSRAQLPSHSGRANAVAQSALPANALSYLSSTYPGYVFTKAFALAQNGTTQGYVVVFEANSTRYAVQFDAAGSFVRVKTIR